MVRRGKQEASREPGWLTVSNVSASCCEDACNNHISGYLEQCGTGTPLPQRIIHGIGEVSTGKKRLSCVFRRENEEQTILTTQVC